MTSTRILLVEDEFALRQLVCEALQLMGYLVTTAVDGFDALAKLANSDFDVVCTDAAMPNGVLGIDVCRRAAECQPKCALVLTSGFPVSQLGELPRNVVFLSKPYRIRDLIVSIEAAQALVPTVTHRGGV